MLGAIAVQERSANPLHPETAVQYEASIPGTQPRPQEADSARAAQINTYDRAVGACIEGRGYTVR